MTDFGSRIKKRQKSLVDDTNHPVGVGNACLSWLIIFIARDKKHHAHLVGFAGSSDEMRANTNTLLLPG